jgi:hypothetical protein
MEPKGRTDAHTQSGVVDCATLYLCRQGPRWVVVIESPSVMGAVGFRHAGPDAYDARFELLSSAHRACPDAAIISTDGALETADYEWRLEVRGIEALPGHLGKALHRELSAESSQVGHAPHETIGRRCHWGLSPIVSGRPRTF